MQAMGLCQLKGKTMANWNAEKQELELGEAAYAGPFTREEVDEGKAWMTNLIKSRGEAYAKLVARITLIRAQVSASIGADADEAAQDEANKVGHSFILAEVMKYADEHPDTYDLNGTEFTDELLALSDEFLAYGTRASTAAQAREQASAS